MSLGLLWQCRSWYLLADFPSDLRKAAVLAHFRLDPVPLLGGEHLVAVAVTLNLAALHHGVSKIPGGKQRQERQGEGTESGEEGTR